MWVNTLLWVLSVCYLVSGLIMGMIFLPEPATYTEAMDAYIKCSGLELERKKSGLGGNFEKCTALQQAMMNPPVQAYWWSIVLVICGIVSFAVFAALAQIVAELSKIREALTDTGIAAASGDEIQEA